MGRTGELVFGGTLEGKPETLSRHHQGRTENLRHVVVVAQNQDVTQSERQAYVVRQDLDLVAGHSPRPRSLGNLEDLVARVSVYGYQADTQQRGQRACGNAQQSHSSRTHNLLFQQQRQVVRLVIGTVRIGHQCSNQAVAIDQVCKGGVHIRVVIIHGFFLGRDAVVLAHGRELSFRSRTANKGWIEAVEVL